MIASSMESAFCGSHAQGVHPGVHPSVRADVQPSALTSTLTPVQAGVHPDVRPQMQTDTEQVSCRKGLSAAQINIIGILLAVGPTVTPYKEISAQLENIYNMKRTPGAVRRSVERLANRGLLRRKQAKVGTSQGITVTLNHEMICPRICPAGQCPGIPVRPDVRPGVHPDAFLGPSILEKKDRSILSISSEKSVRYAAHLESLDEEDIAFHWPELSRAGFGTMQIRQIMERRAQIGETLEYIMQGLTYAEWELSHQCMTTQKGEAVTAPLNWVFKILATQGYYPRPKNFVSAAEQADRDRAEASRREKEAREALFLAESEAWAAKLTTEQKRAILGPDGGDKFNIPEPVRLRTYFRQNVWPATQSGPGADEDREA